jgi:hypothetical protein
LAPELDRRLASDEFLGDIIEWWSDTWRAKAGLYMTFAYGDEAIHPSNFADHLGNFSDNELAVYIIAVISGCGSCCDDNRVAELRSFGPSKLGLDSEKLTDDAYVKQVMAKYINKLEAARTELRR